MTLVVAVANSEYAMLIADRRLTPFQGAQLSREQAEEAPKIAHLICPNARVAFGFSGLARAGTFDVHRWICETLTRSGAPRFDLGNTIDGFCKIATREFNERTRAIPESLRRLSIVFAGHFYRPDFPAYGAAAIVANYSEDTDGQVVMRDEFRWIPMAEPIPRVEEPAFLARIGNARAAPLPELRDLLLPLLRARKPAKAVFRKAVKHIRLVAKRPSSAGNIGEQIIAAVLPADATQPGTWEYESAFKSPDHYVPALVYAGGPVIGEVKLQIELLGDTPKVLEMGGPKPHRNAPCSCKSGKKYRHCHGRSHK